jgi:hypothetical protein
MTDRHLTRVRKKAEAVRRARAELHDAILEARQTGLTMTMIGDAAGLTKQRVHQIIRAEGGSSDAS